jgi:cytochrome c oxidase cbb3-type subunit 3
MTRRLRPVLPAISALLFVAALNPAARAQAPPAYPDRPEVDPAIVARGKSLYGTHCAFCHGVDVRGGDGGGPNLLRSQLVLSDQKGELIGEVVRNGRPGTPMAAMPLTPAQISDIADFIHSIHVGGYDVSRDVPKTIVVGDARAGEGVFKARCSSCHSPTGDLQGFATRFPDALRMQNMWLMPSAPSGRGAPPSRIPPTTVTVTLPSGQRVEGRLIRIDDFVVSLVAADGQPRSFGRNGDEPRVEIHDPLKPHRELLAKYSDTDIHDITAYLVTLK